MNFELKEIVGPPRRCNVGGCARVAKKQLVWGKNCAPICDECLAKLALVFGAKKAKK